MNLYELTKVVFLLALALYLFGVFSLVAGVVAGIAAVTLSVLILTGNSGRNL